MIYPNERQVEYWTSRVIEDYFENLGFVVVVLPISQNLEKHIPLDHMFAGSDIKVFGLQYKRLYPKPDHWKLDPNQHNWLRTYSWIYYAFSTIKSINEHRNALHQTLFAQNSFIHSSRIHLENIGIGNSPVVCQRWGGFVDKLFECSFGWKVDDGENIQQVGGISNELFGALVDIYILSIDTGIVIRTSPFIREIGEAEEDDFGFE